MGHSFWELPPRAWVLSLALQSACSKTLANGPVWITTASTASEHQVHPSWTTMAPCFQVSNVSLDMPIVEARKSTWKNSVTSNVTPWMSTKGKAARMTIRSRNKSTHAVHTQTQNGLQTSVGNPLKTEGKSR